MEKELLVRHIQRCCAVILEEPISESASLEAKALELPKFSPDTSLLGSLDNQLAMMQRLQSNMQENIEQVKADMNRAQRYNEAAYNKHLTLSAKYCDGLLNRKKVVSNLMTALTAGLQDLGSIKRSIAKLEQVSNVNSNLKMFAPLLHCLQKDSSMADSSVEYVSPMYESLGAVKLKVKQTLQRITRMKTELADVLKTLDLQRIESCKLLRDQKEELARLAVKFGRTNGLIYCMLYSLPEKLYQRMEGLGGLGGNSLGICETRIESFSRLIYRLPSTIEEYTHGWKLRVLKLQEALEVAKSKQSILSSQLAEAKLQIKESENAYRQMETSCNYRVSKVLLENANLREQVSQLQLNGGVGKTLKRSGSCTLILEGRGRMEKRVHLSSDLPESLGENKAPPMVAFSGIRDEKLKQALVNLNVAVHEGNDFSDHITHVVAPEASKSIKVLAASITGKWIMRPSWIADSVKLGHLAPEPAHGIRFSERPFRGRKYYFTEEFKRLKATNSTHDATSCAILIEKSHCGIVVAELVRPTPRHTTLVCTGTGIPGQSDKPASGSRMDEELFRKLSAGARFSHNDITKERKRALKVKVKGEPHENKTASLATVPEELDFFGTQSQGAPANPVKVAVKDLSTFYQQVPKKPIFKNLAEMQAFRKEKSIKVYGDQVPSPVRRFIDLARPEYGVPVELVAAIKCAGLKKPTPVQMQATPVLLAGRDAFVVAPTGSGKTLIFVMSILATLLKRRGDEKAALGGIKAIIVSPTRELANQIKNEFRRFTPHDEQTGKPRIGSVLLNKAVLNSWKAEAPQTYPAILISTPQRLVQSIEGKLVDLSGVEQIMLDEADKLLELGLMEQMDDVLAACSFAGHLQKILFSATIPTGIETLARSFMNEDPIRVVIGKLNGATATIDQRLVYVGQEEGKLMAIRQMLNEGIEPPVIIFTETIERACSLHQALRQHRINVDLIHSGRTQMEREKVIADFRAGRIWFLITTELLARGLDFPDVACVINFDFPLSTANYIHRIGRTGRAGKRGRAITFYTKQDADALKIVANVMKQSGCEVPDWMMQMGRKRTSQILKDRRKRSSPETVNAE